MNQGQNQKPMSAAQKRLLRRKLKKYFLVTLSLILLLSAAAGTTIAYIIASGGTVENSFTPSEVLCSVDDTCVVTNDGDIPAFIRAAVVINWGNTAGDINGIAPIEQIVDKNGEVTTAGDYVLTLGEGWEKSGEYYYYNAVVPSKGKTTPVVEVEQVTADPEGFDLVVEVVAEAIQSEGMGTDVDTAQEAWAAVVSRP